MSDIKIIDHSEQINKIKNKYGKYYHHHKEAYLEAAQIWEFTDYSRSGVILNYQTEILATHKSCKANVKLTESLSGKWLIGVYASTPISGYAYSPSIFSSYGFSSYEDARLAGIVDLQDFFEGEARSNNSCGGVSHKMRCEETVKILQAEKQPQLDMFASIGGSNGR